MASTNLEQLPRPSLLLALPTEIHGDILDNLHSSKDPRNFALTCKRFEKITLAVLAAEKAACLIYRTLDITPQAGGRTGSVLATYLKHFLTHPRHAHHVRRLRCGPWLRQWDVPSPASGMEGEIPQQSERLRIDRVDPHHIRYHHSDMEMFRGELDNYGHMLYPCGLQKGLEVAFNKDLDDGGEDIVAALLVLALPNLAMITVRRRNNAGYHMERAISALREKRAREGGILRRVEWVRWSDEGGEGRRTVESF